MTLNDIPDGSRVYIDANIFIYHFVGQSDAATRLLERCEHREVLGVTGQLVLLEVNHGLMVLEALQLGLVSGSNPAARLAKKPESVRRLVQYAISVSKIPQMGIDVISPSADAVEYSREYRQRDGLLTHDAIIAFEAIQCGANIIASNDRCFERVAGITHAHPGDVVPV